MKRKIVFAVAVALMVSFTSASRAEENLISVDFQRVSLGTVLRVLSARTDRRLITDADLAQKSIILVLEDVTADQAIDALMNTYGLYYIRQPGTDIYVVRSRTEEILIKVSHVFRLNYSNARKLVPVLEENLNPGGSITADERTNSIIVNDLSDTIQRIGELIDILDTPTPQVMIEAKIIETTVTDGLSMGMDLIDFMRVESPDSPIYNQRFAPGAGGPRIEFGVLEQGFNIEGFIEAIQTTTDARMLNNPRLLVLSKETASINIVDEIPYQERTITADGSVTATTEFKEVGVTIDVTPYINSDGTIIMDIQPTHSFQTGRAVDNVPIVKSSRVNTSFMLNDGETVVIGGLIRESDSVTDSKVPILGDIPVLGYLFKNTDRETSRNELTIFITAREMNQPEMR